MPIMLTIAVSKGRIWDDAQTLLNAVGCPPRADSVESRSLVIPTAADDVRLIIVRAQDVPTYVACGAAIAGIAGGDVLLEQQPQGIYQPLDLNIARCRLVAATTEDFDLDAVQQKITVATKYVNLARDYFARRGVHAQYIKLSGTMELAPLVKLADVIVDLVETGDTLRANGLHEIAEIRRMSAKFIVNRVMARKNPRLAALQQQLAEAVQHQQTV